VRVSSAVSPQGIQLAQQLLGIVDHEQSLTATIRDVKIRRVSASRRSVRAIGRILIRHDSR
jgi:hypothetical protein